MSVPADLLPALRSELEAVAVPAKAPAMAAYMKDRFVFLGVASPERKRASKSFVAAGRAASAAQLLDAADACWAQPEREFQYTAVELLRRWVTTLDAGSVCRIERLIREKSWWDTVDAIAAHVIGPLVAKYPALTVTMDAWVDDPDIWIARTAVLHQLTYGADTDLDRLFDFVDRRCSDTEFFMRKACGWALRNAARQHPEAVRAYVLERGDRLSGLTRREALEHL
jgi:3-methyladenine DNA glycosylase AlkD